MLIKNTLKKNLLRQYHPKRTAILFTGGLDSTILAILSLPQKPLLVFGAVAAPECRTYNLATINLCQKIAALLMLRFQVINITRQDYLTHFILCLKLFDRPPLDTDLPAASLLLKTLHHSGITSVMSGMGSDEIFRLPKKQLESFIADQAKTAVANHQKIAQHWKIKFHCPYLSPESLEYAYHTPLHRRKNKQALRLILREHPAINTLLQGRPSAHSSVPDNFWLHALALIKTKDASWSKTASKE